MDLHLPIYTDAWLALLDKGKILTIFALIAPLANSEQVVCSDVSVVIQATPLLEQELKLLHLLISVCVPNVPMGLLLPYLQLVVALTVLLERVLR
jgi:hypothetical protein